MRARPACEIDDRSSDVLRSPQLLERVGLRQLVGASRQLQQPVAHLGREEARADAVDSDMPGAQLDGEVSTQMQHGRLAGAVSVCPLAAHGSDSQAGHARRDDDPRRVLDGAALLQERQELADSVEDSPDVQVHHLGERTVGVGVDVLAPGRAGVGQQDVDMVGVLLDIGEQLLHAGQVGAVGGDGDGTRTGREVGECVEGLDGGLARRLFAGRDEDSGGAGLEKTVYARHRAGQLNLVQHRKAALKQGPVEERQRERIYRYICLLCLALCVVLLPALRWEGRERGLTLRQHSDQGLWNPRSRQRPCP